MGDNRFIVDTASTEERYFQWSRFSKQQTSPDSSCQTGAESALCELQKKKKKGQFICINTRYINHTKQKLKTVVLDLHSSNNIISICFLCLQLLLISVELNSTQSHIRPLDSDSFVTYSLSAACHDALSLVIILLKWSNIN